MRRRIAFVALLVVVLVLGTSAAAFANCGGWKGHWNRIFIGQPTIPGRHHAKPVLGTEFKVKGVVYPGSLSTDTVSSVVIQVFVHTEEASGDPEPPRGAEWSQIATVPATWGDVSLCRRRAPFVSYEASVTISDPGQYKLRGAVVQTDTVVAQSCPLPLCFRDPNAPPPSLPSHRGGHGRR
jgi:hypothetical protein